MLNFHHYQEKTCNKRLFDSYSSNQISKFFTHVQLNWLTIMEHLYRYMFHFAESFSCPLSSTMTLTNATFLRTSTCLVTWCLTNVEEKLLTIPECQPDIIGVCIAQSLNFCNFVCCYCLFLIRFVCLFVMVLPVFSRHNFRLLYFGIFTLLKKKSKN